MIYESPIFRVESDDGIVTLWFDFRGMTRNSMSLRVINELSLVLDRISQRPADVLVIRSSRPGSFLEEMEAQELLSMRSPLEFASLANRGQDVLRKLSELPIPSLAVVDGRCRGAGLELALACTHRLAVDSPATTFSFAETTRGLMPCFGSTYRTWQRIGVSSALALLMGEEWSARQALKQGLVDLITGPSRLPVDLPTMVAQLQDRGPKAIWRPWRLWDRLTAKKALRARMRDLENSVDESTAPARAIHQAMFSAISSEGEGASAERAGICELGMSESARRCLEIAAAISNPRRVTAEFLSPIPVRPRRIGVVGAGKFGSALVTRLIRAGHEVVVQERDVDSATTAERRIADLLGAPISPVRPTTEWVGFGDADLLIEAVDEDPGAKREVLAELERRFRPRTPIVVTSNTISIDSLVGEMNRPGRVIGLCVPMTGNRRAIAEIVAGQLTEATVVAALSDWSRSWGLVPVRVADRPGRLVSHVLYAYLSEALNLVSEGLPADEIDAACRKFGFARGPLEWADEIGLDKLADAVEQLQLARGDDVARNLLFERMRSYGWTGKEGGEGLYRYNGRRRPNELARMVLWRDLDDDAIAHFVFDPAEAVRQGVERIVLRIVNEAANCLPDEPEADPATVDLALVCGLDWPAFRGGPLRYADDRGIPAVAEHLSFLAERHGRRFQPSDELLRRAEAGESFFGTTPAEVPAPVFAWRAAG